MKRKNQRDLDAKNKVSFNTITFDDNYNGGEIFKNYISEVYPPLHAAVRKPGKGKETKKAPLTEMQKEQNRAANCIGKLKVRFGAETRTYLAAFIDEFGKQMILNALYNCFEGTTKTINNIHAFKYRPEGLDERMPTHKIIQSLNAHPVFINEEDIQPKKGRQIIVRKTKKEKKEEKAETKKSNEPSHRFKTYINNTFGIVKLMIADGTISSDGVNPLTEEKKQKYLGAHLGSSLCECASEMYVEILERFAKMLSAYIKTMKTKTITTDMVKITAQQMYAAYGISTKGMVRDLDRTVEQYNKYKADHKKEPVEEDDSD
jgi:hypothetical protein